MADTDPPVQRFLRPRRLDFIRNRNQGFDSAEHRNLGDRIRMPDTGLSSINAAEWSQHLLTLAPDLKLSYGQVLALAGDLYGVPDKPISDPPHVADRQQRFRAAFDTLLHCDRRELAHILVVMQQETDWLHQQMVKGFSADQAYADPHAPNFDLLYTAETAGPFFADRYLSLASNNFDHFGQDAVNAYSAGHLVAIETASSAHQLRQQQGDTPAVAERLQLAVAMNAFADHYLTDLFSSGHLRVPRRMLHREYGTQGDSLAKYGHDEDSAYGLFVTGLDGARWQCFGDAHGMTLAGELNAARAIGAVQRSVDEILAVFTSGRIKRDDFAALQGIPDLSLIGRHEGPVTHPVPLNQAAPFIEYKSRPYVRKPFREVNSHHWIEMEGGNSAGPAVPHGYNQRPRPEVDPSDNILDPIGHGLKSYTYTKPAGLVPPPTVAPHLHGFVGSGQRMPRRGRIRWAYAWIAWKEYPETNGVKVEYVTAQGPWSDWFDNREDAWPIVSVPIDPTGGAHRRRIVRHIENHLPMIAGEIHDNRTVEFTDQNPG